MEIVNGECKHCGARLGRFFNLWTQIGKSYHSPALDPQEGPAVVLQGAIRVGEKHTLVDECRLQDIACSKCEAVVGLKCLSTPINHVLDENQILLRSTSVVLKSRVNGREAKLTVKRYLKLREPPRASANGSGDSATSASGANNHSPPQGRSYQGSPVSQGADLAELTQIQADLEVQREDIDRIDSVGFQMVSTLDGSVNRIEREVNQLRDTMQDLKRELGGNEDSMASLKADLRSVKQKLQDTSSPSRLEQQVLSAGEAVSDARRDMSRFSTSLQTQIADVRSDLAQTKQEMQELRGIATGSVATTRNQAKEIVTLRGEMAQLRRQMDQDRSKSASSQNTAFPSRELDILTSNITKIGNRANQVESLQMEFEILKGRVERMESSNITVSASRRVYDALAGDSPRTATRSRKRQTLGVDSSHTTHDDSTHRSTRSAGSADSTTQVFDASAERLNPVSSITVDANPKKRNASPHLTKNGSVDKRYRKRGAKRSLPDS